MNIEDIDLRRLFALPLRPYLHLQLVLADRRHDVGIVFGSKHLRSVFRRVACVLDGCYTNVERTVALRFIQSQHDILIVACRINLVVETHGILWCRVFEQSLESVHLLTVVLNAVVNLLPLKLADISPRVQLVQVDGTFHSETVCPRGASCQKEHRYYIDRHFSHATKEFRLVLFAKITNISQHLQILLCF